MMQRKDTKTHLGWTIGGGAEFALTADLLIRAEYLYDDYGREKYEIEGSDPSPVRHIHGCISASARSSGAGDTRIGPEKGWSMSRIR
jgi:opacity protein-like surface antigen